MIQILFRMPAGNHITIDIHDTGVCMGELKKRLFARTNFPTTRQRYVYNGHPLRDDITVESLGMLHGSTVHVMLRWHGVGCHCRSCKKCILLRNGTRIPLKPSSDSVKGGLRPKFLQDIFAGELGQQPHARPPTHDIRPDPRPLSIVSAVTGQSTVDSFTVPSGWS